MILAGLNKTVWYKDKQSRYSFNHKGNRASKLLKIVHTNICGLMEVKSIGGSRYFLIFEDNINRMTFVYFFKIKDSVLECFKHFKFIIKNQLNSRIKILRSDNGEELCSEEFEKFF